jgi:hypothetical protein
MHYDDAGSDFQMEADLRQLRGKYEAALHQMHRGELTIRRLEEVLSSAVEDRPLALDKESSTAHDFGLSSEHGLNPYTQLVHLEAVLAREEALYEEARRVHAATITAMTRDVLEIMEELGRDPGDIGDQAASSAAAARFHFAGPASTMGRTSGGAGERVARLPADSFIHD